MFINWNAKLTAKDYEKILLDNNAEIGFATKLLIVNDMRYFDKYKELAEEEKDKLIDFVYHYWLENHTVYGTITLFDIVEWTFTEFAEEFKTMGFKEFCDRIDGVYEEIGDNY